MASASRVAERALRRASSDESLLTRMVVAQGEFFNDLFEHVESGLRRKFRTVAARRQDIGGVIPETTYTFRKPNAFYDVDVAVRIVLNPNNAIGVLVLFKTKKLSGNWRPDLAPSMIAKQVVGQVEEILG